MLAQPKRAGGAESCIPFGSIATLMLQSNKRASYRPGSRPASRRCS
jgi:hypothetical protein